MFRVADSAEVAPTATEGLAGVTVTEDGVGTVAVCPSPQTLTETGLPAALLEMLSVSVNPHPVEVAVGVKMIE